MRLRRVFSSTLSIRLPNSGSLWTRKWLSGSSKQRDKVTTAFFAVRFKYFIISWFLVGIWVTLSGYATAATRASTTHSYQCAQCFGVPKHHSYHCTQYFWVPKHNSYQCAQYFLGCPNTIPTSMHSIFGVPKHHSYQCAQYFCVLKQWCGCQCLEFLMCTQKNSMRVQHWVQHTLKVWLWEKNTFMSRGVKTCVSGTPGPMLNWPSHIPTQVLFILLYIHLICSSYHMRMDLWEFYVPSSYWHACQVRVTVGDSGLCCCRCTCVMYSER